MKRWKTLVACAVTLVAGAALLAQPAQNALSIPVKVDANGYLLTSANAYSGQAGPGRNLANTSLKVDSNGYLMTTLAGGPAKFADGTSGAPSIAFASEPTTGFYRSGANTISTASSLTVGNVQVADAGALFWATRAFVTSPADGLLRVANNGSTIATLFPCGVTPTIASGFNATSPSVLSGSGCGFLLDVGTGAATSAGIVTIGATAPVGWHCTVVNLTNVASTLTSQSASSTTTATFTNYVRTTGVAGNFAAGDDLSISCVGR
jgi:hypothetical protein